MSKVITFSRVFPKGHPKAGQPTHFVEKIWNALIIQSGFSDPNYFFLDYQGLSDVISAEVMNTCGQKIHTIRAGKRWKTGDMFSPRVWNGKPYNSPQITIAPDLKLIVEDIEINEGWEILIDGKEYSINLQLTQALAHNDGLSYVDFVSWFRPALPFSGQILCFTNTELPY